MRTIGLFLAIVIMLVSCTQKHGIDLFNEQVEKELASNKRVDSVFFGIHFGMSQQEFYTYCWDMNKKGIFTDGTDGKGSMFILYKPKSELKHPASMNFFPEFRNNTIASVRALYQYEGWAPWNKHLFADSLLPDVLAMYKKWYAGGNDFIEIKDKQKGLLYAKIDGNRRIIITKVDDIQVKAEFTDMLVANPGKNTNAKANF